MQIYGLVIITSNAGHNILYQIAVSCPRH